MKTKIMFAIGVVFAGIMTTGCMKAPMACATIPTTGTVSTSISFNSDCSTDSHHFEWNFGDGAMSSDANPTHTYTAVGTYTVMLTTMSKNEKKMDETSQAITIN